MELTVLVLLASLGRTNGAELQEKDVVQVGLRLERALRRVRLLVGGAVPNAVGKAERHQCGVGLSGVQVAGVGQVLLPLGGGEPADIVLDRELRLLRRAGGGRGRRVGALTLILGRNAAFKIAECLW